MIETPTPHLRVDDLLGSQKFKIHYLALAAGMNSAAFSSSGFKDPRKLSFERDWVRRAVLASYWAVIILGFPLWWHLTSIQRLALPTSQVRTQVQNNIVFPVAVHFDASVSYQNPTIVSQVHALLRDSATNEHERWKGINVHLQDIDDGHEGVSTSESYISVKGRLDILM